MEFDKTMWYFPWYAQTVHKTLPWGGGGLGSGEGWGGSIGASEGHREHMPTPISPNFFVFMWFSGKNWPNNSLVPLEGWSPIWEILDLPLDGFEEWYGGGLGTIW